jgi:hypothetical protein
VSNRVLDLLTSAAAGSWPPADGEVEVVGSPDGPVDAVVAFSAHAIVAADVDEDWVRGHLAAGDDLTGPMRPDFVARLGERLGTRPGSLDVTLAAPGSGGAPIEGLRPLPPEAADHPRVTRARLYRTEVESFEDAGGRGLAIIGRGLAGRWEVAVELRDPWVGHAGSGRALFGAARSLIPEGEYLFAAVAPGNGRALRTALAAGFVPLGGEVLFLRDGNAGSDEPAPT